jgi:hypothetical protein
MRFLIIGFTRPTKFNIFSYIIRVFEGFSPFSHTITMWESFSLKRTILYHSNIRGVHFESLERFKKKNTLIKTYYIPVTDEELRDVARLCIDNAGKRYDFISVTKIAIMRLIHWLGFKNFEFKDRGRERLFCSELSAKLLIFLYPAHFKNVNLDTISPNQLDSILSKIDLEARLMVDEEKTQ